MPLLEISTRDFDRVCPNQTLPVSIEFEAKDQIQSVRIWRYHSFGFLGGFSYSTTFTGSNDNCKM